MINSKLISTSNFTIICVFLILSIPLFLSSYQSIYAKQIVVTPQSTTINNTSYTIVPTVNKNNEKSYETKNENYETKMTTNSTQPIANTPPYTITNSTITIMHQIINGKTDIDNPNYYNNNTTTEIVNSNG